MHNGKGGGGMLRHSTQFQEVGMIRFATGNAQCIVLEEEDLGTI